MIAVSTVWRSRKAISGKSLFDDMKKLPTRQIELEFRIPRLMFDELLPFLASADISVVSIHNYFPVPDVLMPSEGSGDAFLLSSDDEEERTLAVRYSAKTLQIAGELGVKHVIFHLGLIPLGTSKRDIMHSLIDGAIGNPEGKGVLERVKRARRRLRDRYLENCVRSLDELLKEAEKHSVDICLENRYYPTEIPDLEEQRMLFARYDGAPLKYWHDVGHGVIQEHLGFDRYEDLIRENASRIVGVHLHDVEGFRDHLSPGLGEVDFAHLKSLLPHGIIHVMEVHSQATTADMLKGIELLRSCGY